MRDQRRQKKVAGPLPSGREIEWITPDCQITRDALEAVPKSRRQKPATAIQEAKSNQLRMCLKRIGDESVGYRELRGRGLDRYFTPSELELVEMAFEYSIRPTDDEQEFFEGEVEQEQRDDDWIWRSTILLGEDLEKLRDARSELQSLEHRFRQGEIEDESRIEEAEADVEAALDQGLEIVGEMMSSQVTRRCTEAIPHEYSQDPTFVAKEAQDNLVRQCLVEVGGQGVDPQDFNGTQLDEWLSPKEQHLIIELVTDLSSPEQEEAQDFLSTVRDA